MTRRDVILTGIPRSGTTLTCHLLNKLPDVVALHEPMRVRSLSASSGPAAMVAEISQYFEQTRQLLHEDGTAFSKHVDGKVPDNHVENTFSHGRLRASQASKGEKITVDKPLSNDCIVCVKHPAAFTAILEILSEHFPCFATVRNPLAVLASWNTVAFPVRKGHAPAAERLDGALAQRLAQIVDRLDRQICLLSWFCSKYRAVLTPERVLRYEDIVSSKGAALAVIVPQAGCLHEALQNQNQNPLYSPERMQLIAGRLLKSQGAFWDFYTKESVEMLVS